MVVGPLVRFSPITKGQTALPKLFVTTISYCPCGAETGTDTDAVRCVEVLSAVADPTWIPPDGLKLIVLPLVRYVPVSVSVKLSPGSAELAAPTAGGVRV